MIRNWYNQIPHPALKTKREITKYINRPQFTKGTRGKPNEQLFPKKVVIQLPKIDYKITLKYRSPAYKDSHQETLYKQPLNKNHPWI